MIIRNNKLKVVHTYVPVSYNRNKDETHVISREQIYTQLLSALLANREYGNIELYTNRDVEKQILEIGIPYTNINVDLLDEYQTSTFSSFKLKVFESMNTPFLHIDSDTFIFNRLRFENGTEDFVFAHPDQPIKTSTIINEHYVRILSEVYGGFFFLFSNQQSDFKKQNFKISNIPNMNIVYVRDYESFAEASNYALKHYVHNRDYIDSHYYGACYIEQLMTHLHLMEINEKYHNSVLANNHVLTNDRFMEVTTGIGKSGYTSKNQEYPFHIKMSLINDLYTKPLHSLSRFEKQIENTKEITIHSKSDINKFFDFDFYGVQHITFHKWSEIFQCICLGHIANNFGVDWLNRVNDYFKKFNNELSELSLGEKLYQELTGFKFD